MVSFVQKRLSPLPSSHNILPAEDNPEVPWSTTNSTIKLLVNKQKQDYRVRFHQMVLLVSKYPNHHYFQWFSTKSINGIKLIVFC